MAEDLTITTERVDDIPVLLAQLGRMWVVQLLEEAATRLTHLSLPQRHSQYVRTSTLAERAFAEERRSTKVIPHLGDEGSLVKLVFAVLIRVGERWGKWKVQR